MENFQIFELPWINFFRKIGLKEILECFPPSSPPPQKKRIRIAGFDTESRFRGTKRGTSPKVSRKKFLNLLLKLGWLFRDKEILPQNLVKMFLKFLSNKSRRHFNWISFKFSVDFPKMSLKLSNFLPKFS